MSFSTPTLQPSQPWGSAFADNVENAATAIVMAELNPGLMPLTLPTPSLFDYDEGVSGLKRTFSQLGGDNGHGGGSDSGSEDAGARLLAAADETISMLGAENWTTPPDSHDDGPYAHDSGSGEDGAPSASHTSDTGSPGGKPNKVARNAAERKRRAKLRDAMSEIKQLIPTLRTQEKISKAVIYRKTVDWLRNVDKINEKVRSENIALQVEVHKLKRIIQELSDAMAGHGPAAPLPGSAPSLSSKNSSAAASPSVAFPDNVPVITDDDIHSFLTEAEDTQWTLATQGYGVFGQMSEALPGKAGNLVSVYVRGGNTSPIDRVRSVAVVPSVPMTAFAVLYDMEKRKVWDSALLHVDRLDLGVVNSKYDILYTVIKSPSALQDRDYVLARRCLELPDGTFVICLKSTSHPRFPLRPEYIRGEVQLSGYVIRPVLDHPNQSFVINVSQVDVKGNTPMTLANQLAVRAPFIWFDAFISATKDCDHNLVDCWKKSFLRFVLT